MHTPKAKGAGVFKSPAPSNKKCSLAAQLGAPLANNGGGLPATNVNHFLKSPHIKNHTKLGSNSKLSGSKLFGGVHQGNYLESNSAWIISPVCSRMRDHISLLGGGGVPSNQKERLFLNQSPQEDGLLGSNGELHSAWPLQSPALDTLKVPFYQSMAGAAQSTGCSLNKHYLMATASAARTGSVYGFSEFKQCANTNAEPKAAAGSS